MTLAITPHMLAAAYDCLREFPPFKRWKLPEGDEVEFQIVRSTQCFGFYIEGADRHGVKTHTIQLSAMSIGHLSTMMRTVAHEMIHMHEVIARKTKPNTMHSAYFHYWARRICDTMGWDYREFV